MPVSVSVFVCCNKLMQVSSKHSCDKLSIGIINFLKNFSSVCVCVCVCVNICGFFVFVCV